MSRNRAPVSGSPLQATRYTGPASDKTRHFQESFCVFCVNVDCVCEIVQQGKILTCDMGTTRLLLLTITAALLVEAQTQSSWLRWLDKQYQVARSGFTSRLLKTGSASKIGLATAISAANSLRATSQHFNSKFQEPVPDDSPFPCDTGPESPGARSATRPTSVHRLRPGDIDVVCAMGDSLTAGTGTAAAGLVELAIENRGMSWSGGGESTWREYLTLPNILREYNPALIGYSLKDSLGSEVNSQFNVAEPLAETRDMAFQAKLLVRRMRSDKRVNYKDDWKMVTMMIGSNDFCSEMCYLKDISVASELHKKDLTTALDYLRDNVPRTIVNLVAPPQLRNIQDFKGKSALCALINDVECPCLFGLRWHHLKDNFTQIMRDVQKTHLELATSGRYNSKDDFTVVGHRFFTEATIPNKRTPRGDVTDFSFLSEDCFHFSQKTHAMAANSLWNSLLEPVGNKTPHAVDLPFSRFLCPAEESPYIFTDRNSVT